MILFLAAVVAAGVVGITDGGQIKDKQSVVDEHAAKVAQLRQDIGKTNLEFRGFSESIKNIPEDRREAEIGRINEKTKDFNKIIRVLENDRKETSRIMRRHQRELDEVKSHLKKRLAQFGGLALVFLVGFIACGRYASIRT